MSVPARRTKSPAKSDLRPRYLDEGWIVAIVASV
jgi:hypothetical protein